MVGFGLFKVVEVQKRLQPAQCALPCVAAWAARELGSEKLAPCAWPPKLMSNHLTKSFLVANLFLYTFILFLTPLKIPGPGHILFHRLRKAWHINLRRHGARMPG